MKKKHKGYLDNVDQVALKFHERTINLAKLGVDL